MTGAQTGPIQNRDEVRDPVSNKSRAPGSDPAPKSVGSDGMKIVAQQATLTYGVGEQAVHALASIHRWTRFDGVTLVNR